MRCFSILIFFSFITANAQVGVNTSTPATSLDIVGNPTITTDADGLLTPRITGDQLRAKTAYGADQEGALVYVTAPDSAPSGQTINVNTPGYYYFDGTVWQIIATASLADGDAWGVTGEDTASDVSRTGNVTINNDNKQALTLRSVDNLNATGIAFQNSGAAYTWNIFRENNGSSTANLIFAGGGTEADPNNLPERMRITNGGNVGIGSDNPGAKLTVTSPGVTDETAGIRLENGTANSVIYMNADSDLVIQKASENNQLVLDDSGRIGVNTDAPTARLDVNGFARVRGIPAGAAADDVVTTDANGNLRQRTAAQIVDAGGGLDNTDNQALSLTGNILTLEDGGTVNLSAFLDNTDNQAITTFDLNPTTNILTITLEDGGTQTVNLNALADADGDAWGVTGEDVISAISRDGNVTINNSNKNALTLQVDDNASSNGVAFQNTGGNFTWNIFREPNALNETNAELVFSGGVNGAGVEALNERMRLDELGRLGLNTNDPTARLDVDGNARVRDLPLGAAADGIVTTDVDGNLRRRTAAQIVAAGGGLDNTDNQALSLTGNILTLEDGGTVNLTAFLDNTDNQAITTFDLNPTTNILTLTLEDGGTQTVNLNALADADGDAWGVTGEDVISAISRDGNVTINNSNKNALTLQVDDNASSNGVAFQNTGGNFTWNIFREPNALNETNAELVFSGGVNGAGVEALNERMRLDELGRLGLNTNDPTARLDVNGNARVRDLPLGAAADDVVTTDANGNLRQRTAAQIVDAGGGVTDNLYIANGALTGDRTVTQGNFDLNFDANTLVISGDDDRIGVRTATPNIGVLQVGDVASNGSQYDLAVGDADGNGNGRVIFSNRLNSGQLNGYSALDFSNQPTNSSFTQLNRSSAGNNASNSLRVNETRNELLLEQDGGASRRFIRMILDADGTDLTPSGARISSDFGPSDTAVSIEFFDGNIGIDTDAPLAKLDVNGNARVRTLPAGAAADGIVTTDATGNLRQRTLADVAAAGADGDAWGVTGEDIASDVSRTGNVTINNDNKQALTLRSVDNLNATGIAFQNSGAAYTWNIFRENNGSNTANLIFAGGGTEADPNNLPERMRITNGGNVGIGSNNPGAKLTVTSPGVTDNTAGIRLENGTANSVIYMNADSDLVIQKASENNQLVLDDSGRIGVNTDAPTARLDVNGFARVRGIPAGAAADDVVTTDATGNLRQRTAAQIVDAGGGVTDNLYIANGALTGDRTVTQGNFDLNFDANTLVISGDDNRIGVRTATPNIGVLQVGDVVTNGSQYDLVVGDADGNGNGRVAFSNRLNSGQLNGYSTTDFSNQSAGSTISQFNRSSAGNNASNSLRVNETRNELLLEQDSSPDRRFIRMILDTDGTDLTPSGARISSDFGPTNTAVSIEFFDGNIGIDTDAPLAKLDVNGNARVRTLPAGAAADGIVTTDANGNLRQRTLADVAAAGADGDAWGVTGEDVAGNINRTGNVTINNTNNEALTIQTPDNTASNGIAYQNSGASYTWNIFREDAGGNAANLVFAGGPASAIAALPERMRVASNGNVGIANANPNAPLTVGTTVNGSRFTPDVRVGNADGNGDSTLVVGQDADNQGFIALSQSNNGFDRTTFTMISGADDATSNNMFFDVSDFNNTLNMRFDGANFEIDLEATVANIGSSNSGGVSDIYMVGNNIGINEDTPEATLDINGDAKLRSGGGSGGLTGGATQLSMAFNATNSRRHDIRTRHNATGTAGNAIDFVIHDQPNDAATDAPTLYAMTVTNRGNALPAVGIGKTNPNQALDVVGNIRATGNIIVQAPGSNIPDYVFEKYFEGNSDLDPSYKMLSLEEIEAFTKANKHLPGVQNATQVKENGLIVNELSRTNLEKVEELFLHTIEQEKKINTLKEVNKQLQESTTTQDVKIKTLLKENQELKNRLLQIEKALGISKE